MSEKTKTLAELESDLNKAIEDLKLADDRERDASRNASSARNRVNNLQKLMDLKVTEMRTTAPYNTDWKNSCSKRVSV